MGLNAVLLVPGILLPLLLPWLHPVWVDASELLGNLVLRRPLTQRQRKSCRWQLLLLGIVQGGT